MLHGPINIPLETNLREFDIPEGGFGVFGFADLANFLFGFSVFALKNCGFSVLVSRAVCGFSPI